MFFLTKPCKILSLSKMRTQQKEKKTHRDTIPLVIETQLFLITGISYLHKNIFSLKWAHKFTLCNVLRSKDKKKISTRGRRNSRMDAKSDSGLVQALVETCDSPQELRKRDNGHRAELTDCQTFENHCSYSYQFAVSQETTTETEQFLVSTRCATRQRYCASCKNSSVLFC